MRKPLLLFILFGYLEYLNAQDSVSDHYRTNQFDVAIFHKEYADYFAEKYKRFTPSRHDVETAEYALREDYKKEIKMAYPIENDTNGHWIDLYKRQYFGYIDKKGHKILFINCFPEPTDLPERWYKMGDWLRRIYEVMDDPTNFSYLYDLKANKIIGFGGGGIGP